MSDAKEKVSWPWPWSAGKQGEHSSCGNDQMYDIFPFVCSSKRFLSLTYFPVHLKCLHYGVIKFILQIKERWQDLQLPLFLSPLSACRARSKPSARPVLSWRTLQKILCSRNLVSENFVSILLSLELFFHSILYGEPSHAHEQFLWNIHWKF